MGGPQRQSRETEEAVPTPRWGALPSTGAAGGSGEAGGFGNDPPDWGWFPLPTDVFPGPRLLIFPAEDETKTLKSNVS